MQINKLYKMEENKELEEEKPIQYVAVPNAIKNNPQINYKILYVYARLRKYMNQDTLECYPSLDTLSIDTGLSINTLRKYLDILEEGKHIKISRKRGCKTIYKFNPKSKLYKENFERFTFDFLNNNLMSHDSKAMIIYLQEKMYKDDAFAKITGTHIDMCNLLGCSMTKWKKHVKEMEQNNILTVLDTKAIDPDSRTKKKLFNFDLQLMGQAILFKLKDHEDRITDTENRVTTNEEKINKLEQQVAKLTQMLLDKNHTIKVQNANINELKESNLRELKQIQII